MPTRMALLPRINMAMTSLSVMIAYNLMVVHAGDFDELSVEDEIGTYTSSYFRNRKIIVESLDKLNGTIVYNEDLLWLTCDGPRPFVGIFPPFKNTVYPKRLAIRYCVLPTSPLADALRDLNINVPTIEFLQFATEHITEPLPKANYMQGLNLKSLFIDSLYSGDMFIENPEFLKPLTNLTTLMVWGTLMPEIPENIHLEVISLRHEARANNWTNCRDIRMLSIYDVNAIFFPRYWPEECKNLTHIRLKGLTTVASHQVMASDIGTSSSKLQTLYMQFCNLTNPPYDMLKTAKNLKHLNFTGNRITDRTLIEIPLLQNLTNLDLSRNFLTGTELFKLVKQTPNLQYFNLNGNWKFVKDFCNQNEQLASQLKSLERLSLRDVPAIGPDCFRDVHFSKLEYLDLSSSEETSKEIESIDLRQLPTTDAKQLKVDLRGRKIKWVQFDSDDYFALRKGDYHHLWGSSKTKNRHHRPHLTVFLNTTEYDCRNRWFCFALQQYSDLITIPDLKCPTSLETFFQEGSLNCEVKYQKGCTIKNDLKEDSDENGTVVKCDGMEFVDLETLSEVYNLTKVDLRNNAIATMQNLSLPESVEWIDLRGNLLSKLDESDFDLLFENPKRRMLLSNNSFICDCKLIKEFHEHKSQIEDFDQITCADKEELLTTLNPEKLCKETSYKTAFIATACIIFFIKITFLAWWYNGAIRRYINRKGWCKCCCKSQVDDVVAWESARPNRAYSQQDLIDKW